MSVRKCKGCGRDNTFASTTSIPVMYYDFEHEVNCLASRLEEETKLANGRSRGYTALVERLAAAEEKVEQLTDQTQRRENWLRDAKKAWGVDDRVSFDVVWKEALSLRSRLGRLRDWFKRYDDDAIEVITLMSELRDELADSVVERQLPVAEFKDYPREPCCLVCGSTEHLKHPSE